MKRSVYLILLGVLILAMTACSAADQTDAPVVDEPALKILLPKMYLQLQPVHQPRAHRFGQRQNMLSLPISKRPSSIR